MTRPAALRSFDRAALALLCAFGLSLLALLIRSVATSGTGSDLLLGIPGIIWLSLPIAAAAALVGASPSRAGAAAFLTLEILLIVSAILFLLPDVGWGSAIGLAILPVLQAGAIIASFVIALAFGWRMRPDFLKT